MVSHASRLPFGNPSQDTFQRILAAIDPLGFREAFIRWGIHMVSAWRSASTEDATENFAIVRHMALNLLRAEQSKKKRSINTTRKRCGWDHDYIHRVMGIDAL